jgi:hypothetical protein
LAEQGQFRKESEYWSLGYAGKQFRLKDTKGLAYIAHLLRYPGTEVHALDLARGGAVTESGEDQSAGLPLNAKDLDHGGNPVYARKPLEKAATAAYRRRLADLRDELQEAKALGLVDRAESAERKIDALIAELSRASGSGGRDRRSYSDSERARQSVTRAITAALNRITDEQKELGQILSRRITTGAYCCYHPDANHAISWDLAPSTVEDSVSSDGEGLGATQPHALAPPASGPSSFNQTEFVGRQREIDLLRGLVERAHGGHGQLVMIGGEPGVGKTRLATALAEYASQRGFFCNIGHCYEREEPYPYLPFVEILEDALARAPSPEVFRQRLGEYAPEHAQIAPSLRRVFPDIPPPVQLPPPQARRHLFQGISETLKRFSDVEPLFLILDDLQWADEATLALLTHLANRVAQIRMVIVGIYRDLDLEDNPALVRTLEELIRVGVRPLKLQGLCENAVAEMLRNLCSRQPPAQLVRVMFEQTAGNPFFVEELYRHLAEEGRVFAPSGEFHSDFSGPYIGLPDNVRLVLSRRLERLDEQTRDVLAAAAAIGYVFRFEVLQALNDNLGLDGLLASLERAERKGLIMSRIDGNETTFTFAHHLVRQTLLANTSIGRRELLRTRVAEALEGLH